MHNSVATFRSKSVPCKKLIGKANQSLRCMRDGRRVLRFGATVANGATVTERIPAASKRRRTFSPRYLAMRVKNMGAGAIHVRLPERLLQIPGERAVRIELDGTTYGNPVACRASFQDVQTYGHGPFRLVCGAGASQELSFRTLDGETWRVFGFDEYPP